MQLNVCLGLDLSMDPCCRCDRRKGVRRRAEDSSPSGEAFHRGVPGEGRHRESPDRRGEDHYRDRRHPCRLVAAHRVRGDCPQTRARAASETGCVDWGGRSGSGRQRGDPRGGGGAAGVLGRGGVRAGNGPGLSPSGGGPGGGGFVPGSRFGARPIETGSGCSFASCCCGGTGLGRARRHHRLSRNACGGGGPDRGFGPGDPSLEKNHQLGLCPSRNDRCASCRHGRTMNGVRPPLPSSRHRTLSALFCCPRAVQNPLVDRQLHPPPSMCPWRHEILAPPRCFPSSCHHPCHWHHPQRVPWYLIVRCLASLAFFRSSGHRAQHHPPLLLFPSSSARRYHSLARSKRAKRDHRRF